MRGCGLRTSIGSRLISQHIPCKQRASSTQQRRAARSSDLMEVRVVSSTIVRAPGVAAAESVVPLTVFDKFCPNMHIAVLYAFAAPTASNEAVKDGLVKTLSYFPTLTGQLGRDSRHGPCIHVGGRGGGALVVEATAASELADHLPLEPSPDLERLHPPTEGVEHLLQVQLNRFQCGGLVVGVTSNHRVTDGYSMGNFFLAWGKTVRGLPIDPLPVHDCRRWLQPRHPPRCDFQHWGVEFEPEDHAISSQLSFSLPIAPDDADNIDNVFIHFSPEFIQKALKSQLIMMSEERQYSTVVCLLAHLWRKITTARGLEGEQTTQLRVAVNGRRRLKPPVPAEFFGNLVLDACPRAKAKELLEGGVQWAARLIHEAIHRIGDDYFRSFLDFGSINEGKELKSIEDDEGRPLHPDLEADSLLGLRFNDMDFGGGGGACAFAPTWIPAEGVIVLLPSLDGGVDVIVTLFQEHAGLLRKISHSLE